MDVYLIDGNSYVYRAFHAIKSLSNSKGFPTNAIFGFTNMLLKIIRDKRPDGLAVSFDTPVPTERHRIFEDYKANRPQAPAELLQQLPHIRRIIGALNIGVFEAPGYEADDVLGTIARRIAGSDRTVYIVTGDKDMLQVVDRWIKVYDPMKDRVLDEDAIRERYGVGPGRVAEFIALTGDAVDNIPGARGVGEKTAKEILQAAPSLGEILSHPELITRDKVRQLIVSQADTIRLSERLATIDVNVPVDVAADTLLLKEPDWPSLQALFREFEFSSLMRFIPPVPSTGRVHGVIRRETDLRAFLSGVRDELALDTEAAGTNPLTDRLVGIAVCAGEDEASYIPIGHSTDLTTHGGQMEKETVLEALRPVLDDQRVDKIGHNLKYDVMLLGQEGAMVEGRLLDTMVAAYLLNPDKSNHSLDETAMEHLGKRKQSFSGVLGRRKSFAEVPIEEAAPYASQHAALSLALKDVLFPKLEEEGLSSVYFDIEMPLIRVLIGMERAGIRIDAALLDRLAGEMSVDLDAVRRRIFFIAGEEFNINSPKQLRTILFERLGLSASKKTKTGFSTGMDVLEDLAASHELPREILAYRSLSKLKSTYLDVLPRLVNQATGRLHTSFNQTATATGRLSSRDPNLQNIPARGEWGRRIREAFVAEEGSVLLSADYSQVELRILAHLSGDPALVESFRNDLDVHARTASEIYGVPIHGVTPEMRRVAKTVNFGVIYGISAFGLSEALDIGKNAADTYIKQYFDRHPGVRSYREKVIREATDRGMVTTLFGRKRLIPQLKAQDKGTRMLGERLAVNSPIQGSAADIIKIAMIRIWKRLGDESLQSRMILQVHDELLLEVPERERDRVQKVVREEMEGAACLAVPLKVDVGYGGNWALAH